MASLTCERADVDTEDELVFFALKTPLDVRAVTAAFPPGVTLDHAITSMRKAIPAHDAPGHHVLDNVEREMTASRPNVLVVRPDGVTIADRSSRLREIATPVEMRTSKGVKTVPAVAVEVQAYASVGA